MALGLAIAIPALAPFSLHATKSSKKQKTVLMPKKITKASGTVTYSGERFSIQNSKAPVKLAFIAPSTDPSSNWAGIFSAHVLSERVIDFMENRYTAAESYAAGGNVRNFVYFYGFDVTSQDARGALLLGIDPRQELELRNGMARSLRGYMLGKGLMEYLKTLDFAEPYVSTVQRVEKASQISVEISPKTESGAPSGKPWKVTSGPDLGSRTLFAKISNDTWHFEARDSFRLNDLRLVGSHSYRKNQYSLRFFGNSKTMSPSYQYEFAKLWWARYSSDLPLTGDDRSSRIFHTVGVRHLF